MIRIIVWFFLLFVGLIAAVALDLRFSQTLFFSLSFHIISSFVGLVLLRLVAGSPSFILFFAPFEAIIFPHIIDEAGR